MIVHEDVDVPPQPKAVPDLGQQVLEMITVPIVAVDSATLVTARRHVIPTAFSFDAQRPGHDGRQRTSADAVVNC